MLAPLMPHFASELWTGFVSAPHRINKCPGEILWDKNVLDQPWPKIDDEYCMKIRLKVNYKRNLSAFRLADPRVNCGA